MWKAFQNAAKVCIPSADIVHGRFHLVQYLNNAVDITRRAENKKLIAQNDDRLKGTKYLWLKNSDNLTDKQEAIDFFNNQVKNIETIKNISLLKVAKTFKNHLQGLIDYTKHRVSNTMAECINMTIQQIKFKARGLNLLRLSV